MKNFIDDYGDNIALLLITLFTYILLYYTLGLFDLTGEQFSTVFIMLVTFDSYITYKQGYYHRSNK